jgi:hypothetical protein
MPGRVIREGGQVRGGPRPGTYSRGRVTVEHSEAAVSKWETSRASLDMEDRGLVTGGGSGDVVHMVNIRLKVTGQEEDVVSAGVGAKGGDSRADPLVSK